MDPSALAEWLGWYLAEGSVSGDRVVRFSLGAHERPQADRLRELTYVLFGCELRVVQAGSSIEASFCHALLGRWLKQQCGNGAHSKRLPSFVWQWSSADQWRLFHGLMLGDGEMPDGVALFQGRTLRKQWRLGLASPTLIDDVRDLLLLNGVRPTSLVEERAPDGRRVWRLWIPADVEQAWGRLAGTVPVLVRVRKVDRVPYAGPVHNLTVAEDHTYVTFSGTVCNCGFHGDVISYVMARESCTFLEACERLAVRGRPPMAHPLPAERGPRVERRWETLAADSPEGRVMQLASQTYQQQLWAAPYALQYLRQRAVPLELAREQQVGYADGRSLLARLRRAGVDAPTGRSLLEIAEELGLVVARPAEDGTGKRYHEFFFRRLIVPELRGGCAIWFIGRTIELPPPPGQPVADDQRRAPKYLSLGGERPVFGLEAVVGRPAAYLVEGPFDWLAARAWQLPAFSICGTHFPQERLPVLDAAVAIYGVFDPDRAGRSAAERFAPLFGDRWRPVRLPNGLDLAEVAALGPAGREMFDALVGRARAEAWLGTGAS